MGRERRRLSFGQEGAASCKGGGENRGVIVFEGRGGFLPVAGMLGVVPCPSTGVAGGRDHHRCLGGAQNKISREAGRG